MKPLSVLVPNCFGRKTKADTVAKLILNSPQRRLQDMSIFYRALLVTLAMNLAAPAISLAEMDAAADAETVVQSFNRAITQRDQEAAVAQLIEGGVQFTLRSLHDGVDPDKLVTPILAHWSMVVPVLFASTSRYTREVEIIDSEAHGDVATVWTNTKTVSVRKGKDAASTNEFTEVYLLVSTPDGWRIASIADNRSATALQVGDQP